MAGVCLLASALLWPPRVAAGTELARRVIVNRALQALTVTGASGVGALVHEQLGRLSAAPSAEPLSADDELFSLRSQNDLAPARRQLEEEWQQLRTQRPTEHQTRRAFDDVLALQSALDRSSALAEARQWSELDAALPPCLIAQFERAATVLASSESLSEQDRLIIGWQWGACGWRRCGAQADVSQSLAKLRANLGMIVPIEALFYLDVAKRATDDILGVGVAARMVPPDVLRDRKYLTRESLELILPVEDLSSGDANIPVIRGGNTEAEDALDEYESSVLGDISRMLQRSSDAEDDEDDDT